jgi:hypothetical protein
MSLKKEYVRDGKRRIIGSVTSGFSDESAVVRNEDNEIVGRTSERFHTTRDGHGNLISINSPDPGLLLGRRK